jgi:hypothetical protein
LVIAFKYNANTARPGAPNKSSCVEISPIIDYEDTASSWCYRETIHTVENKSIERAISSITMRCEVCTDIDILDASPRELDHNLGLQFPHHGVVGPGIRGQWLEKWKGNKVENYDIVLKVATSLFLEDESSISK